MIYVYGMVMEAMKQMYVIMMFMKKMYVMVMFMMFICGGVETSRWQLYAVVPLKKLESLQSVETKMFKFIMEKKLFKGPAIQISHFL